MVNIAKAVMERTPLQFVPIKIGARNVPIAETAASRSSAAASAEARRPMPWRRPPSGRF